MKLIKIFILFLAALSIGFGSYPQEVLADSDEMQVLALSDNRPSIVVCHEPGIIKAVKIFAVIIVVIKVMVPIMLSVTGIMNLGKAVVYEDDNNKINYELTISDYDKNKYSILLSHRPELFETYVDNNINLVFTGHAHGGQIRIPFIGGIIAPNQGLFPKYTSGIFTKNETNMIVSRGIGNSLFPFRINNNPELVIVELNNK